MEKEKVQLVITGTFPVQRFFDTLAAILSRRENIQITVKVTQKDGAENTQQGEGLAKQQTA